ncbi:MAG: hypothetical protein WC551_08405 [Patescibacteria group bacterium]
MNTTQKRLAARVRGEVMTREKFIPLFEDIKELIKSTAKGTENILRKDLGGQIQSVKEELHQTQLALKATKEELKSDIAEVRGEMKDMETRLRSEIKDTEGRLNNRIDGVETNLGDKIDSIHVHIDDHETRITTLETPGH